MRKPDNGLRHLFHAHLPLVHWQAVETGATGWGVPDSNGCHQGVEFWVEFKATAANAVVFQPGQVAWMLRRVRAGGRCWLAVRRKHSGGPRKGPPVDELWLYPGVQAQEVATLGLQHPPCGRWGGGPGLWPWSLVLAYLTGGRQP